MVENKAIQRYCIKPGDFPELEKMTRDKKLIVRNSILYTK